METHQRHQPSRKILYSTRIRKNDQAQHAAGWRNKTINNYKQKTINGKNLITFIHFRSKKLFFNFLWGGFFLAGAFNLHCLASRNFSDSSLQFQFKEQVFFSSLLPASSLFALLSKNAERNGRGSAQHGSRGSSSLQKEITLFYFLLPLIRRRSVFASAVQCARLHKWPTGGTAAFKFRCEITHTGCYNWCLLRKQKINSSSKIY